MLLMRTLQYLHSLALFYLKLQAKTLLPALTIQDIIDEFQQIDNVGQSNCVASYKNGCCLLMSVSLLLSRS